MYRNADNLTCTEGVSSVEQRVYGCEWHVSWNPDWMKELVLREAGSFAQWGSGVDHRSAGVHRMVFERPETWACAPQFLGGRVPIGWWPRCQNASRKRKGGVGGREKLGLGHRSGGLCTWTCRRKDTALGLGELQGVWANYFNGGAIWEQVVKTRVLNCSQLYKRRGKKEKLKSCFDSKRSLFIFLIHAFQSFLKC